MRIAAIQHDIVWEDSAATRRHLEPMVAGAVASGADLVVVAEMFATGFSLEADRVAEDEGGPTSTWMLEQAATHGVWLYGSVAERPAGGAASQRRHPRRPGRHRPPLRQAPPLHLRRRARGVRRRHGHGDGRRGGRPDQPVRLLRPALRRRLVAAGARPPTSTCAAPTGRRRGEATGSRSCRRGPSRTRPTWSGSTASARAAGSPTRATAASSIPLGEMLAGAARTETVLLADIDAAEVAKVRERFRFLQDRRTGGPEPRPPEPGPWTRPPREARK